MARRCDREGAGNFRRHMQRPGGKEVRGHMSGKVDRESRQGSRIKRRGRKIGLTLLHFEDHGTAFSPYPKSEGTPLKPGGPSPRLQFGQWLDSDVHRHTSSQRALPGAPQVGKRAHAVQALLLGSIS